MEVQGTYKLTPVTSSADEIWDMPSTQDFSEDMWGHYRKMTDALDIVSYTGGKTYSYDPLALKLIMGWLGMAMPSVCYINPNQTLDLTYFEHVVSTYLPCPHGWLVTVDYPNDSSNVAQVFCALSNGFYRLISGRALHDGDFHAAAKSIYSKIMKNGVSSQGIYALDTVSGRFEVLPNLMALMVFELHDKFFGTDYSQVKPQVMQFIDGVMRDEETGLFCEMYQTGYIGYPGEPDIASEFCWRTSTVSASVNALIMIFYSHFNAEGAASSWQAFKGAYASELLSYGAEEIGAPGSNYYTPLASTSEAFLGAMAAAREMNDKEFFGNLQDRLFEVGGPVIVEGSLHWTELGDDEEIVGFFIYFARSHQPWATLLDHDWETYYNWDFKRIH